LTVDQVISTVVGQTYILDFEFSNYPFSAVSGNEQQRI